MYHPAVDKPLFAEHAAQGGKARASVLTPDERKAIARTAALARWANKTAGQQASMPPGGAENPQKKPRTELAGAPKLPIALFPGKLKMGSAEFAVYVLDNGKRVMAQREVVRVLTGRKGGKLTTYLEAHTIRDYIDPEAVAKQTLQFSIPGTQYTGNGYEATLLLDICDAYLRARDDRTLTPTQLDIAKQAEIITRACAKVGIIALIDEATGYQAFRRKQELQLKLQAFIAEDLQEWALMFPQEFWFELARLEGVHYSPRSRPLRWGNTSWLLCTTPLTVTSARTAEKEPRSALQAEPSPMAEGVWTTEGSRSDRAGNHDHEAVRGHERLPVEVREGL
jgi:hypothetical protein